MDKINIVSQKQLKGDFADVQPGTTVRVFQKVKEGDKIRTQAFEGTVIARKHGSGINAMITVRKIIDGIGAERVFPLHAPSIEKIEVIRRGKVRRAKLYYMRKLGKKAARTKELVAEDASAETKHSK
jgi:large subunit ribosomal protein L19